MGHPWQDVFQRGDFFWDQHSTHLTERMSAYPQSESSKGNEKRVKLIQGYRTVVEKELDEICGEILGLLDAHLIPSASTTEASVFYLKMKADYHRYLAEFKARISLQTCCLRGPWCVCIASGSLQVGDRMLWQMLEVLQSCLTMQGVVARLVTLLI
jgi:hypothetical protein